VIRAHFTYIANGDFEQAFNLFTPSYQAKARGWVAARSAAQPAVSIAYVGTARISGPSAYVPTKIYLRDTVKVARSDTQCRRFEGTLPLVKVNGSWRYAPTGDDWHGTILPRTISDCP
jgi:hypothetical protein